MVQEPATVQASDVATRVRAMVRDRGYRAFPVLDDDRVVGIVTRGDILKITSNKTNLLVEGVMSKALVTAEPDEDIFSAAKKMLSSGVRQLLVLEGGKLAGMVTAVGILSSFVANAYHPVKKKVSEVMTSDVLCCEPGDELSRIWDKMQSSGFSGFPVVVKGKVQGMVTRMDIFRHGVRISKESGKPRNLYVQKVMQTPPITLGDVSDTKEAAELLVEKGIIRLPVVDEKNHLKGIVDIDDILAAYAG